MSRHMKTIAELREDYRLAHGVPVDSYKAYPVIGRGTVIHDWIRHDDVEARFGAARVIPFWKKLGWLMGGRLWM